MTAAGHVTGLCTALSTIPAASVPPHPLPNPEGGGESRKRGGSEKPSFIKAAGTALPARPCRLDLLRSPQPHVIAPTQLYHSELGGFPIHPQTFAEMRALLNQGGKEAPMKEGAELGVPAESW